MTKKTKVKITKKLLNEKYPVKGDLGEEIWTFAKKVFVVAGVFLMTAVGVDIYHFTHFILDYLAGNSEFCSVPPSSPWPGEQKCIKRLD